MQERDISESVGESTLPAGMVFFLFFFGAALVLHSSHADASRFDFVLICGGTIMVGTALKSLFRNLHKTRIRQYKPIPNSTDRSRQMDDTFAAAHEAGHALTYAALQGPSPKISMTLEQVGSIVRSYHIIGATWNEWRMFNALAGQAAEKVLLGDSSLSSATDCTQWLPLARAHCANHFAGIFYAEPRNLLEHNANDMRLSELRKDQLQRLAAFFETNRGVLNDLATTLNARKRLDTEDLAPYLKRVAVPEDFPKPVL